MSGIESPAVPGHAADVLDLDAAIAVRVRQPVAGAARPRLFDGRRTTAGLLVSRLFVVEGERLDASFPVVPLRGVAWATVVGLTGV